MKLQNKLLRGGCLALLIALPCTAVSFIAEGGEPVLPMPGELASGRYGQRLEAELNDNFPYRRQLAQLGLDVKLLGGQRLQNDIYINQGGLLFNTAPANDAIAQRNTQAVLQFAQEAGIPTYLTLVPTASAVKQQLLPSFAQPFNQSRMIEETYNQMSGRVTTVDTYSTLFNRREEYVYYRTADNLTSLGGYYVYTAMGNKLGLDVIPRSQYEVQYLQGDYLGELYQRSPYKQVRPDTLALYRYTRYPRRYVVTHRGEGEDRVYHDLYPLHLQGLGRDMDVYLGGISPIVDVQVDSPYNTQLLVFGDETASAYLPFLANHYQRVTFVDLEQLGEEAMEELVLDDYDQVLFAYGLETYIHQRGPSRALWFVDAAEG